MSEVRGITPNMIKRRIANRQDKKEFDPSKHPRAEEGDVNAQGEKNGGQFVSKEEQEGQTETNKKTKRIKKNSEHDNFPNADRYKRINLGSRKPYDYDEYEQDIKKRTEESAQSLKTYMGKSSYFNPSRFYGYMRFPLQQMPNGSSYRFYSLVRSNNESYYSKPKRLDRFSLSKDDYGNISFKSEDGDFTFSPNDSQATLEFCEWLKKKLDSESVNLQCDYESGALTKKEWEKSQHLKEFGGFYKANNGGDDIKHFSPNPSMLCMVSPTVIDFLDDSFDCIDSDANRQALKQALSVAVISDVYTGENDTSRAYYSQTVKQVYISKNIASGLDESVQWSAGAVAHESSHYYDFYIGRDSRKAYSVLYKQGAFLKSLKKSIGDFLDKFGYKPTMEPEEISSVRDAIISELTNNGFTIASYKGLSDMIDAYTSGKLNLGFGHTVRDKFYWDDDTFSQEGYADFSESLTTKSARAALEYSIKEAVETYDTMNSDLLEWQKNPLLKYVPIPLPMSLTGEAIPESSMNTLYDKTKEISDINRTTDEEYEDGEEGKKRRIRSKLKTIVMSTPFGASLGFTGTNPDTGKAEDMKLIPYKTDDGYRYAILGNNGEPIEDSEHISYHDTSNRSILNILLSSVYNKNNPAELIKMEAL